MPVPMPSPTSRHRRLSVAAGVDRPKLLRVDIAAECKKYEAKLGGAAEPGVMSMARRFDVRAYRVTTRTGEQDRGRARAMPKMSACSRSDAPGRRRYRARADDGHRKDDVIAVATGRAHVTRGRNRRRSTTRSCSIFRGDWTWSSPRKRSPEDSRRARDPGLCGGVFLRSSCAAARRCRSRRAPPWIAATYYPGRPKAISNRRPSCWIRRSSTNMSDMVFVGVGIVLADCRALTIRLGGIPLSSSTAASTHRRLVFAGCVRASDLRRIPAPALWILNNVGLTISSPSSESAPARALWPD